MIHTQVSGRNRFCNTINVFVGIIILVLFSNCDSPQACTENEEYTKFTRSAYLAHHDEDYASALRYFKKAVQIKPRENVTDLL